MAAGGSRAGGWGSDAEGAGLGGSGGEGGRDSRLAVLGAVLQVRCVRALLPPHCLAALLWWWGAAEQASLSTAPLP
jgi:hypothetical protein